MNIQGPSGTMLQAFEWVVVLCGRSDAIPLLESRNIEDGSGLG